MSFVLIAGIPAIPAVLGVVLGVIKDGSPFRRSWWTAG